MIRYIEQNPHIKAKDLSHKFEVSERTIYRDLRELDHIVPIVNDRGNGYRIGVTTE